MGDTPYLHGTSDEEQDRLALMNGILNEGELAALGLAGNERCLELGAGTGVFARELAARLPRGSVLAIERDERQLWTAVKSERPPANLELRRGDALDPPLSEREWGRFDLVHARFLLEHLQDPLGAVRVMVRAVRPGGRIVLVDDDHDVLRLAPELPGFSALWAAYCRQYEHLRTDPYVGRRLCALLVEAGARPTRTTTLFYGGCAGVRGFEGIVENLTRVVGGSADAIVAAGALSAGEVEQALTDLAAWSRQAGAALWYSLPLAEGTRD